MPHVFCSAAAVNGIMIFYISYIPIQKQSTEECEAFFLLDAERKSAWYRLCNKWNW